MLGFPRKCQQSAHHGTGREAERHDHVLASEQRGSRLRLAFLTLAGHEVGHDAGPAPDGKR